MEIEIKKVINDITEHLHLLSRVDSTVKRISKILNIPTSAVYVKSADFSKDGDHIESNAKIIIL